MSNSVCSDRGIAAVDCWMYAVDMDVNARRIHVQTGRLR